MSSDNIDQFLCDFSKWSVYTNAALLEDATLLHLECFIETISTLEARLYGILDHLDVRSADALYTVYSNNDECFYFLLLLVNVCGLT